MSNYLSPVLLLLGVFVCVAGSGGGLGDDEVLLLLLMLMMVTGGAGEKRIVHSLHFPHNYN